MMVAEATVTCWWTGIHIYRWAFVG